MVAIWIDRILLYWTCDTQTCISGQSPLMPQNRQKRSISETERLLRIAFTIYGTAQTVRELINMAASLEKITNNTAEEFTKMNAEMVARRQ